MADDAIRELERAAAADPRRTVALANALRRAGDLRRAFSALADAARAGEPAAQAALDAWHPWARPDGPGGRRWCDQALGALAASAPVEVSRERTQSLVGVADDAAIVVSETDGRFALVGIDATSLRVRWKTVLPAPRVRIGGRAERAVASLLGPDLLAAHGNLLHRLEPSTGALTETVDLGEGYALSLVGEGDRAALGLRADRVLGLDLATGRLTPSWEAARLEGREMPSRVAHGRVMLGLTGALDLASGEDVPLPRPLPGDPAADVLAVDGATTLVATCAGASRLELREGLDGPPRWLAPWDPRGRGSLVLGPRLIAYVSRAGELVGIDRERGRESWRGPGDGSLTPQSLFRLVGSGERLFLATTTSDGVEVRGWSLDGAADLVSVGLSDPLGLRRPQLLELAPLPGALLVLWQGGDKGDPLRLARLHG